MPERKPENEISPIKQELLIQNLVPARWATAFTIASMVSQESPLYELTEIDFENLLNDLYVKGFIERSVNKVKILGVQVDKLVYKQKYVQDTCDYYTFRHADLTEF
jgi:hypothetical protein